MAMEFAETTASSALGERLMSPPSALAGRREASS